MHPITAAASRAAATASAVLLTVASAGFGTYYAWTNGAHHGPVLGSLAVAMAMGLELCKPFAVSGAFSSLRRWRVGQSLALAALGLVAVAYSLSAELSLMATTRGDHSRALCIGRRGTTQEGGAGSVDR